MSELSNNTYHQSSHIQYYKWHLNTKLLMNEQGISKAVLEVIKAHNIRILVSHLPAMSLASLLGGGTVKQTEGTMASFPAGLITFHLAR